MSKQTRVPSNATLKKLLRDIERKKTIEVKVTFSQWALLQMFSHTEAGHQAEIMITLIKMAFENPYPIGMEIEPDQIDALNTGLYMYQLMNGITEELLSTINGN